MSKQPLAHGLPEKLSTNEAKKAPRTIPVASGVIGVLMVTIVGFGVYYFLQNSSEDYTEQLRTDYVAACVAESDQQSLCECTYDKLSSQLAYAEFKALDERVNSGETVEGDTTLLTGVLFACVNQNKNS